MYICIYIYILYIEGYIHKRLLLIAVVKRYLMFQDIIEARIF